MRNRIDQFGVAEPVIQKQGDKRIIIQHPGLEDQERARSLIGTTALLEFRLVRERDELHRLVRELDRVLEGVTVTGALVDTTGVTDGAWHHAAATYDGTTWVLYLDGVADGSADEGSATPRHDSIQHLAVGTAINTAGDPAGRFRGAVDEVRLWSAARTEDQLWETVNAAAAAEADLVARWAFDEGGGELAADDIGGVDGALVGAAWVGEAPLAMMVDEFYQVVEG